MATKSKDMHMLDSRPIGFLPSKKGHANFQRIFGRSPSRRISVFKKRTRQFFTELWPVSVPSDFCLQKKDTPIFNGILAGLRSVGFLSSKKGHANFARIFCPLPWRPLAHSQDVTPPTRQPPVASRKKPQWGMAFFAPRARTVTPHQKTPTQATLS